MSLVLCISSPNIQPITHFDIFAQKEEAFLLEILACLIMCKAFLYLIAKNITYKKQLFV
jgi:hypothetical protein